MCTVCELEQHHFLRLLFVCGLTAIFLFFVFVVEEQQRDCHVICVPDWAREEFTD
jgi:hypothetical protein